MKYVLEFEAPDDWKPVVESACWVNCPFSGLTPLGKKCRAKIFFDEYHVIICPVVAIRKQQIMPTCQQEEVP